MLKGGEEELELQCPECGSYVKATPSEAEKGALRCPRGHEFPVMGMLSVTTGARGSKPP